MFFDDRLAMPGIYGGSVAEAVRTGARPVKLDLSIVLGVVAGATEHIGLGATYSTTYYAPFHVARTFATLDHLSGGRAAWNIVTSVNDSEAQNFGVDAASGPRRALRPGRRVPRGDRRAVGHLGRRRARCSTARRASSPDPRPCDELEYKGEWFKVRGPLTVPRSPQGRPVLLQAGSSGRGRDFAARWAEVIFTGDPEHRHRPLALPGPEGAARRGRARPGQREDAADGLRGGGRDPRPGRGPRAAPPQRPRRPDGVADAALRADEPRLRRDGPRRSDHRRADRVGERHPRARAEHQEAHRRRHRHPGRPGRAPRHPPPRALASSAPAGRSPTRWRSGSAPGPATAS